MGKSVGFIGNFKGKLGNTVGYKVSQSNSGTNQGVRVYQPNIKNPKSAAQAEQRAKYAPIFATYNALKSIIDRGNESKPYGNASRIAWLKKAFRAEYMPWFIKGSSVYAPVLCELTKGSLAGVTYENDRGELKIICNGVNQYTSVATIGDVTSALMANYSFLKAGDQITIVIVEQINQTIRPTVFSFILDSASTETQTMIDAGDGNLFVDFSGAPVYFAVIVSREGTNGEHLRSTSPLLATDEILDAAPYDTTSKEAAIASYMASGTTNTDWAEESIQ
jgi:hypothetical protein